MVKLTKAQAWALRGLADSPEGMSPSSLGQHMSDRPEMSRKGGAQLNKAQGYGRLGAYMAALLRKNGWATSGPAHRTGPTYQRVAISAAGRAALRERE